MDHWIGGNMASIFEQINFHKLVFEISWIFFILSYSCFCSPTFMKTGTDGCLSMITCSDKGERDAGYQVLTVSFGLFLTVIFAAFIFPLDKEC